MMLDTFFIAVEAFDIITVQLPVVDIESRMGIKAWSGKALGIWNQNNNKCMYGLYIPVGSIHGTTVYEGHPDSQQVRD
jgi:hypothetical protein